MPNRSASGRHTASRHRSRAAGSPRRRRLRLLPSPAAIGVLAVIVAGGGVVAAPNGLDGIAGGHPARLDHTSASYSGSDAGSDVATGRAAGPTVSRGAVDRNVLKRQAKQQAEQRAKALATQAAETEQHADRLAKAKKKREARQERQARQWVLPVAGYHLTARFGQSSSMWSTVHTGLDFAAPTGTQIVSVARGTVTQVGYAGAYGNQTIVTLEDGTEIWYNHQSSTQVGVGDSVDPGDPIGTVGATGNVTGPHLHLEVRPGGGEPVDPYTALQEHNVTP
ncbi:MAG: M23 family metallopeptidase [Nocardioidaceae bacterium]